jgi:ATP-binding cassette subfamily B protein
MLSKLILRYIRPYWGLVVGVVLAQTVACISGLVAPTLNAQIIDNGVAQGDTDYIWQRGGIMLGVAVLEVIGRVAAVWCGAQAAMGFGRDVRAGLFDHVLSYSSREVSRFGAPSLITRNTNDVQQVQQLLMMSFVFIVSAPITMVGGVVMALREDPGLSWLILVAVVVLGVAIGLVAWRMLPLFRENQTRIDTVNRVLREQITGIRVIRAFIREPYERQRFEDANSGLLDLGLRIGTLFSLAFPIVNLVLNGSSAAVMWFGSLRVDSGDIQVGQITAFISYLIQILMSVMMATMMMMQLPRAQVCAARIMEVLGVESSVVPPEHGVTDLPQAGTLEFKGVSFAYPGAEHPVLNDLNFSVRPGTTTAVIGATGSGKTTLVNLIPRLFDATKGQVLVDGVDVRDADPDALWARIGLVPQKPYLFSGTVASNLRYGKPDADDAEMWDALTVSQATDFVAEMDGGLEARIAQGGTNVSGGQRQRLSIARALVKKPDVYVFDDAFSALDVATDARLRAALAERTEGAAVVIVAQRVSSIRDADQILVLDQGRIVGIGTHAELLAGNETYGEIVASQMSAEEALA